ncbi:MAG TPA: aminotransferase class I/II-fold pyridoxal phosphate-dependent enzyme [Chitinophagaceae bacterium]|nr:aminotransferase class I/II-fold pyridoxal phosphate-dependent enzyme [Chitinophagaceae bacterium]
MKRLLINKLINLFIKYFMLRIADKIKKLGTETAFAVSAEAAAFAAKGNKVYPFHIGDMNFSTPSTVVEGTIKAIHDGKTGYCPTTGIPQLREAIADDVNAARRTDYSMENVAVQPGGKPTIGKFILALLNPGDEVLYPNPGYPIYESQIEFNGAVAVPYTFVEGKNNFVFEIDAIKEKITPKTKVIILNDLQNPSGAEFSKKNLEELAAVAIKHNLIVLSDEAYFDIRYEGKSLSIASIPEMQERTVILYSFSKRFAMTGWRLGATIAPKEIINVIAKLNVNDESCSNHFIQYGAIAGLRGDQSEVKKILSALKERRDACVQILNSVRGINCFNPNATFYLFPNVTALMKNKGFSDYELFRKDILYNTGVSFCTRMHFGRPLPGEKNYYIRIAYSGINLNELTEGLNKFKNYINSSANKAISKKN